MKYFNLVFVILFLTACESGTSQSTQKSVAKKLEINDFEKQMASVSNIQLVDVRSPEEYSANHLAGALNIDYNGDAFETMLLSLDKNKPTFVYCLSGGRSASAAKALINKGFKEIYDMKGGMVAWKAGNKSYEAITKKAGMSQADFEAQLATDKLVLVDFNAKWCAPCQKMLPMVTKLAETYKDKLVLMKIDFDENEDLVKALNVSEIPLLLIYKNGKVIWQKIGLTEQSELEKIIGEN